MPITAPLISILLRLYRSSVNRGRMDCQGILLMVKQMDVATKYVAMAHTSLAAPSAKGALNSRMMPMELGMMLRFSQGRAFSPVLLVVLSIRPPRSRSVRKSMILTIDMNEPATSESIPATLV